ncbi:hypothetical protein MOUN0_A04566 [Monosporozyma unispora]|nr:hypothetical protein C6P44_004600 [Kazachstania unispora]
MCEGSLVMYTNFKTQWVNIPPSDEILFQTKINVQSWEKQSEIHEGKLDSMLYYEDDSIVNPGFNVALYECVQYKKVNNFLYNLNINIPLNNNNNNQLTPLRVLPFSMGQLSLNNDLKNILQQLAKIYKVDIICTQNDVYHLLNQDNNHNCLYVIGNQLQIINLQNVIEFVIQDFNLSQRVKIPSLQLCTALLSTNNQNLNFFKWAYNIMLYMPHTSPIDNNDMSKDLYIGGDFAKTTEVTLDYIKSIYSQDLTTLNKLMTTNLTGIYTIPLGKIEFLKRFRTEELNNLSIDHQSYIHFGPINHTTESCPLLINSISNDLAESCLRDLSLHILQNIIEVTFYYEEATQPSLNDLFSQILKDEEYIIIKPSNNQINSSFTLIMDYNKFLLIVDEIIKLTPTITQFKTIFQIHYDFENFISGKKNGKLTRIMDQEPNCIIRLLNNKDGMDDSIMNLEILSDSTTDFTKTLNLVIDELPVEESFYIGEVFHRPIIGSGGSIIQTIMRKYNVFIQFSNSFNLPQLGWSLIRYPNVVIRCPGKNQNNIKSAKQEIIQLVNKFKEIQEVATLALTPTMYQYIIINKRHTHIPQIEKNYNVFVNFPQPSEMINCQMEPFTLQIGSSNTTNTNSSKSNDSHNNKKTAYNAVDNFKELVCGNETNFQMSDNFESFIKKEINWFNDSIILQIESLCKAVLKISPDNKSLQLVYTSSEEYEIVLRYLTVLNDKFNVSIVSETHLLGSPSNN